MGGGDDDTSPKTLLEHWTEEFDFQNKLADQYNSQRRTIIGQPPDGHWIHSRMHPILDLTRPAPPEFPLPDRGESIELLTSNKEMVVISPAKTALVIIDMQNFFLSPALGRDMEGAGNIARKQLLAQAIPAADAAGMQVVWLNEDIDQMPASILYGFGAKREKLFHEQSMLDAYNKPRKLYRGLGNELGEVTLEDGSVVQGGRMLMRDYWNTDLPPDLKSSFETGRKNEPAHVWMHKNRMSGLWNPDLPFARFLKDRGICTLLFAGVNTDQCVGGTLQDAYSQGYDCIMISDICGTSSPNFAKECIEYNTERSWGFLSNSLNLKQGVDRMLENRAKQQAKDSDEQ